MFSLVKRLFTEERGQGMAEYGLILAVVAIVVVVALGAFEDGITGILNRVTDALNATRS